MWCQNHTGCEYWTLYPGMCVLWDSPGDKYQTQDIISGPKFCPSMCWCKSSDAGGAARNGSISGDATCGTQGEELLLLYIDHETVLFSNHFHIHMFAGPACLIQHNLKYDGGPLLNSPEMQADWQSCQSFCLSNYPTSTLFNYISSGECWCKRAYTVEKYDASVVSGELDCTFQQREFILFYCLLFQSEGDTKSQFLIRIL